MACADRLVGTRDRMAIGGRSVMRAGQTGPPKRYEEVTTGRCVPSAVHGLCHHKNTDTGHERWWLVACG